MSANFSNVTDTDHLCFFDNPAIFIVPKYVHFHHTCTNKTRGKNFSVKIWMASQNFNDPESQWDDKKFHKSFDNRLKELFGDVPRREFKNFLPKDDTPRFNKTPKDRARKPFVPLIYEWDSEVLKNAVGNTSRKAAILSVASIAFFSLLSGIVFTHVYNVGGLHGGELSQLRRQPPAYGLEANYDPFESDQGISAKRDYPQLFK